jgi:hypothetical protein
LLKGIEKKLTYRAGRAGEAAAKAQKTGKQALLP